MIGGLLTVMIQPTDKAPRPPRRAGEALPRRIQGQFRDVEAMMR